MKVFFIIMALSIVSVIVYFSVQALENPPLYEIPEGIDPDKPIIVRGIEFDPKEVYSTNKVIREQTALRMKKMKRSRTWGYHREKIPPLTDSEKEYLATAMKQAENLIGLKIDFVKDINGRDLYENFEIIDWNPNGPQIKTSKGNVYRVEYWRLDKESQKKLGYDKKFDELHRKYRLIEDSNKRAVRY